MSALLGLTQRQADLLAYLQAESAAQRRTPSYAQMACHLKLKSGNSISRLLAALQDRGYVRRSYGIARSVRLSETKCPKCGHSFIEG